MTVPATGRSLARALFFIALVVAAVGSLGAPLITSVATTLHVSLASAQWTLTITLLAGAVATPVLGRLGTGPHRRSAILATLVVVVSGSVLTVLPLPFAVLLVGRAAQGVGLGLTALMMAVARDHLGSERAPATIALVSVASTIGIGIGYPLAGLLAEIGGIRAAYGLGVFVTSVALVVALVAMPAPPRSTASPLDLAGALLLGAGLLLVLIPVSETSIWTDHAGVGAVLLIASASVFAIWLAHERRTSHPLVDVSLLRLRAVAGANMAMLVGGLGMYLLLTLITRYAQTPRAAGYGFGLSTFEAGLVLVPFSALGFVGGRIMSRVSQNSRRDVEQNARQKARKHIGPHLMLAASAVVVLCAFVLFALARSNLVALVASMAILGFGVGSFSAAMPGVILAVTPRTETSSAMSVNQVVRSVGFSVGSAIGGLVLAAGTEAGKIFPTEHGYSVAAWIGAGAMAATAVVSVVVNPEQ